MVQLFAKQQCQVFVKGVRKIGLETCTTLGWSPLREFEPAETLIPDDCWALMRGKSHVNDPAAGTLCCMHNSDQLATL